MAVARINQEIARLRLDSASQIPRGGVSDVTVEEWNAYVKSDNQELKSSCMEWVDGEIYIVELPSLEHDYYTEEMRVLIVSQPAVGKYLKNHGTSPLPRASRNQVKYQADASYGPTPSVGVNLLLGVPRFAAWRTFVIEVGYSRKWGTQRGFLDWKAQRWAAIAGVRYILCVAVEEELKSAEYKLYTVQQGYQLLDQDPMSVVAPQTLVSLDPRVLLGLGPGDELPRDPLITGVPFSDPFAIDLYAALERARVGMA